MVTIQMDRALPVLSSARVLIHLERSRDLRQRRTRLDRRPHDAVGVARRTRDGDRGILDERGPLISEIPETAPMARPIWIGQCDQETDGRKPREEMKIAVTRSGRPLGPACT